MTARRTFYITTAIDYVNSTPHLGTAYEKISADVIARLRRLEGYDTFFLMGNDEHSQNVATAAEREGMDPLAYCDRMAGVFRTTWERLEISHDDFIRTTEPRHRKAVEALFRAIHENDDIYKGSYSGYYCVSCEAFQLEKDLVDGRCRIHETVPEWITEENYFFRLSRYGEPLREHILSHPEFIQPESRRNEMLALIDSGLTDISISRAGGRWGIPLPIDPSHTVYVWFDALINYLSGVGYPDGAGGREKYWPADVHVIGKDITRFHCVIWPAMLMSARVTLPRTIFGHGWVSFRGQKLSKSLGNIIDPLEAAEKLGPDALRYFLVREIPFGKDGDFSWDTFIDRYNADLANDLGNLVMRSLSMARRYLDGRVPPVQSGAESAKETSFAHDVARCLDNYREASAELALSDVARSAIDMVRRANRYVEETAPWSRIKEPEGRARVEVVLATLFEAIRLVAVLLSPVMPRKAGEVWNLLGLPGRVEEVNLLDLRFDPAAGPERMVAEARPLFPRIEITSPEPTAAEAGS
jgi:methionyl-tRNA synthetase